nr:hypothetical protein [Tanacetum cinerariifolium]GEZ97413.1 hypothetical protein [Tanacetum cinerariifolium]
MYLYGSLGDCALDIFFIIVVQTPGSGIFILLAVGTPSTGSGNLYCQWELSPGSGNALCILFLTNVSSPQVTPIISTMQQTSTPIPTPPITTDAPTITTAVLESNALTTVELRVAKLEKDVSKLKTVDHSYEALVVLQSYVPTVFDTMIEDENAIDKGVTIKDYKRKHDDNEDDDNEDPSDGPNQGKKTKRRRTKESESSKKPSTTKETQRGKTLIKGSKTGKSASVKELVKEPIAEVIIDDTSNDVVILDQPAKPWFNQMVSTLKDPLTFNDLMATPIDITRSTNFFNNDLEYLKTSNPEVTYTTYIMKTKVAQYEIKGIKDMVPTLWRTIKHVYDKDASMGMKQWGERRKLWYRYQVSKFSKKIVYSTKAILGVKSVSVKKLHGYGHLDEIVVKRSDQQLYKFKEGDFVDLHLNNIEDMLLLTVKHKLFHLDESDIVNFIMALRVVYEDLDKQKRALQADELYKFSHGILKFVYDEIHHRVLDFRLDYNKEMPKRKWTAVDQKRSSLMVELIDKQL